ncbi:phage tail protein [Citromicrobium sp. JLT1363]|jgi:microcystin-dependent protein|uniref:phage tail protein n=1 Tax=Citromicrobium sp. JLT1363 TaxID=517722 RepID=UPI000225E79D|nr:tail fiber protein [Citromicrobium sp. JLT1363]|tara:strand:+ start:147 stop:533 length:387 start_codon:yes stop_codon:yes gene_type:complete
MKFGLLVASVAAIASMSIITPARASADPLIGEIMMVGYQWCPRGWEEANGQLLPISENGALFSLYGTTYGGDGRSTFALPDLRGRAPVHVGPGNRLGEEGSVGGDGSELGTRTLRFCVATRGIYPSRN